MPLLVLLPIIPKALNPLSESFNLRPLLRDRLREDSGEPKTQIARIYSTHPRILFTSVTLLLNDGRLQDIGLFERASILVYYVVIS